MKAIRNVMVQKLKSHKSEVQTLENRLQDPRVYLRDSGLRCDELVTRMTQKMMAQLQHKALKVQATRNRLVNPQVPIDKAVLRLKTLTSQLHSGTRSFLKSHRQSLQGHTSMLDSLSPLKVIDRGYAIVKKQGNIVRSVKSVQTGDVIDVQIQDGVLSAKIEKGELSS